MEGGFQRGFGQPKLLVSVHSELGGQKEDPHTPQEYAVAQVD